MFEDIRKLYNEAVDSIKRHYYHRQLLRKLRGQRTIVLIPGHCKREIGNDPGACANGTTEHEEVVKICNDAWNILSRDDFNAIVIPDGLTLVEKINWVNTNFPDCVMLSVHMNASTDSSVRGVESWYLSGNEKMREAADEASKIMNKHTGIKIRDSKGDLQNHHGRLGILRDTQPKDELLIELGFITNEDDLLSARHGGARSVAEIAKAIFYK